MLKNQHLRRVGVVLLSSLLGGCVPALQQGAVRDAAVSMPGTFLDDASPAREASLPTRAEFFKDPHLIALINESLSNNQEVLILGQAVAIYDAEVRRARGEYVPRLHLGVGAGVEKVGRYTSQGASDAAHDIEPGVEMPEQLGDLDLRLGASWEVDIWGKLRKQRRSAQLRYLSSIDVRNFAITQLVAEVSDTYYELLALDSELTVVSSYIDILRDSLEIVRLQKEAGRTSELAVQRFQAELYKNEARRFEIRQEIAEAEYELNFLCGRYPQPIERSASQEATQPLSVVTEGVPTALLQRRPDLLAAEKSLEAAKLDVKAARAEFYPSLSIDGSLGVQAFRVARLAATPESILDELAGGLLTPLLNRSGIKAEYFAKNAEQMTAVLEYEQAVLNAYIEVATQVTNLSNLNQSYALQRRQVDTLELAVETSTGLFQSARADYLEVLTTRRDALEAEIELIETKRKHMTATVDLYKALGGGWDGQNTDRNGEGR